MQYIPPLYYGCVKVASIVKIAVSALFSAKAVCNFLFHFCHPHIMPGEFVVKWYAQIVHKYQCFVLMQDQTVMQFLYFVLFVATLILSFGVSIIGNSSRASRRIRLKHLS